MLRYPFSTPLAQIEASLGQFFNNANFIILIWIFELLRKSNASIWNYCTLPKSCKFLDCHMNSLSFWQHPRNSYEINGQLQDLGFCEIFIWPEFDRTPMIQEQRQGECNFTKIVIQILILFHRIFSF